MLSFLSFHGSSVHHSFCVTFSPWLSTFFICCNKKKRTPPLLPVPYFIPSAIFRAAHGVFSSLRFAGFIRVIYCHSIIDSVTNLIGYTCITYDDTVFRSRCEWIIPFYTLKYSSFPINLFKKKSPGGIRHPQDDEFKNCLEDSWLTLTVGLATT